MQNNARIGGVLSIVAGALGFLGVLFIIFLILVMAFAFEESGSYYDSNPEDEVLVFVMVFYGIMGLLGAAVNILAIVGGILALRKRYWGWALAGSIAATLAFFPCGIPAIIFIAMGKPEFETLGQPVPAAPITG